MMRRLLILGLLLLLATPVFAAPPPPDFSLRHYLAHTLFVPRAAQGGMSNPPIVFQNQGTPLGISFTVNCSTGMTCSFVNGVMTMTAAGGGGFPRLDQVLDPTADKTFAMGATAFGMTWGAATGSTDMLTIQDTVGNTGFGSLVKIINNSISGNNTLTLIGSQTAGPSVSIQNHFVDMIATAVPGGPFDGSQYGAVAPIFESVNYNSTTGSMIGGAVHDTVVGVSGSNTISSIQGINVEFSSSGATPVTSLAMFNTATGAPGNTSTAQVGTFSGYQFTQPNAVSGGGFYTNLIGYNVGDVTRGVSNWAIKTGLGMVELGDALVLDSTTVGALPAAAAGNKGWMRTVSDSTAVAAEGQTCVGGNTNTALAFSNGTVWKCF